MVQPALDDRSMIAAKAVRDETLALLGRRATDATICPSEVARALAARTDIGPTGADWREMMPHVHDAIDQLVADGQVGLSWKGEALKTRVGPYRIRRGSPD